MKDKKSLAEKAKALYPNNRVEESGDANAAPLVYFTPEDLKAGPTAASKKFGMSKGTAFRNLKKGYFRPGYLKFDSKRTEKKVKIDYSILTIEEIKKMFPHNRVDGQNPDGVKRIAIFLTEEERSFSVQEITKKFSIDPATAARSKENGFFNPAGIKVQVAPSDWAMKNAELIVKAARLAIKKISWKRFGGKLQRSNDLVSEIIYHMFCTSGKWKPEEYDTEWGMVYCMAHKSAQYAFTKVFTGRIYGRGELPISYLTESSEEGETERKEEKILSDGRESEEKIYLRDMLNNVRQAIVETFGDKAWQMVWRWAQSERTSMPEGVQKIIESITLN